MEETDTKLFGFWIYLLTDLMIFAALFATYIVLQNSTFGGPTAKTLFHLPFALAETLLLLTSSFTCSLATFAVFKNRKASAILWFLVTFVLGAAFLGLELAEFSSFIAQGADWRRSGFLSAFFALVGTHGLHVALGLLWMGIALVALWFRGLPIHDISRIVRLALFWHFLDIVWIFIFTVVYAMGAHA
jgi:cytochrome o ubiquinol oxidase subunit III